MGLVLLIVILTALASSTGMVLFESVFLIILATPVFSFILGSALLGAVSLSLYLAVLAALALALAYIAQNGGFKFRVPNLERREIFPIVLFCLTLLFFHRLSLLWPDFIAIGERLRDYALLSSVINHPLEAREPWMVGSSLNYYLYWYRFGHFLSVLFKLPVWEVYHLLAAFALAFYMSSVYRLLSRYLNFSPGVALLLSLLVALGSNTAGVIFFLNQGSHWWGPSRVIAGAINEFPAWSFLLGDLHPHYLNLGLVPFFACLGLFMFEKQKGIADAALLIFGMCAAATLWLYNSNAWEVPIWGALLAVNLALLILLAIHTRYRALQAGRRGEETTPLHSGPLSWRSTLPRKPEVYALILGLELAAIASLYLSSRNILPPDSPWKLVSPPAVPRTELYEILLHWGIPLTLIAVCQLILQPTRETAVIVLALIVGSLLPGVAPAPLSALLFLALWRVPGVVRNLTVRSSSSRLATVLLESLGITALALIIVPEICYLDDPYGGENERMNTIFKIYSATWFMLHIYAFNLVREAWIKLPASITALLPLKTMLAAFAVFMLGFTYHTIDLRKSSKLTVKPFAQGLSNMEERFPGAAKTIQTLAQAKPGVVLEAQGPPYDVTSHVATLSGHESYLGWANHVGLLTRRHDEVRRRESMTDTIYRETDCAKNMENLRSERIDYLVVGPLEKARYPEINQLQFACLKLFSAFGGYQIYQVPP